MNTLRRNVLKGAGSASAVAVAVAAGLLKPTEVMAAWNKAAFEAKDMDEAMKGMGASGAVDQPTRRVENPRRVTAEKAPSRVGRALLRGWRLARPGPRDWRLRRRFARDGALRSRPRQPHIGGRWRAFHGRKREDFESGQTGVDA